MKLTTYETPLIKNVYTKEKSVKDRVDNEIRTQLKKFNTEISFILLTFDDIKKLSVEIGVTTDEIIDQGYCGYKVF